MVVQRHATGGIHFCTVCRVSRLVLQVCFLVLLMGREVQNQDKPKPTTTPKPPKLDTLVTVYEMEKVVHVEIAAEPYPGRVRHALGRFFASVDEIKKMLKQTKNHMRFCDTDQPIYDNDMYCNRIISIVAHTDSDDFGTGRVIVSGIFIDNRRILTSYTPFRTLRHKVARNKIQINYIVAKAFMAKTQLVGYVFDRVKVACARQIVAMEHKFIVEEQWHGPDKTHTPMHDLMIFKVEKPMVFIEKETWHKVEREKVTYDVMVVGPKVTPLAEMEEDFPTSFKIISLGFMDDDHVYNKNHLHTSKDYIYDDKVLEDCEEWFPRDWGYFFCVKNDDDFVSIGSGALLVGGNPSDDKKNGKVFGMGSFMLKKNKASILVFTDIRPYLDAMNMTCNGWDGN